MYRGIVITQGSKVLARTVVPDDPANRATLDAVIAQNPGTVLEITDDDPRWSANFGPAAFDADFQAAKNALKQQWQAAKSGPVAGQIVFLAKQIGLE